MYIINDKHHSHSSNGENEGVASLDDFISAKEAVSKLSLSTSVWLLYLQLLQCNYSTHKLLLQTIF